MILSSILKSLALSGIKIDPTDAKKYKKNLQ